MAAIRAKVFYQILRASKPHSLVSVCPQVQGRFISTSNKNKDTSTIDEAILSKPKVIDKTKSEVSENNDWISYGFSFTSEEHDRKSMHVITFASISIGLVFSAFILAYMPDLRARDWVRRESFLELNRRERLGLPLVSPDYIDPKDIVLPSEEELGDTEIII